LSSWNPHVYGELEAEYTPLFLSPPTGRLHHVDVGPALGFSPWPTDAEMFSLELRARFEVGLGGGDEPEDDGYSTGLVLFAGVRVQLDRLGRKNP
jgi:hypothetical protein